MGCKGAGARDGIVDRRALATISSGYRHFLKHAVSKKLHRFESVALPAILENDEANAWFLGVVRGYSNVREKLEKTLTMKKLNMNGF